MSTKNGFMFNIRNVILADLLIQLIIALKRKLYVKRALINDEVKHK